MILHDVGDHSVKFSLSASQRIPNVFGPALHTSELLIHNSLDLIPRGTQCVRRAKGSKGPLLEAVDTNNGWKDTPSTRRHGMVFGTRQANQKAEAAQSRGLRGSVRNL